MNKLISGISSLLSSCVYGGDVERERSGKPSFKPDGGDLQNRSSVLDKTTARRGKGIYRASAGWHGTLHEKNAGNSSKNSKILFQKVDVFKESEREKYPNIIAANNSHIFIKGPDKKIRRFPVDHDTYGGSIGKYDLGRALLRQVDLIYDAPAHAVISTLAGFHLNEDSSKVEFLVNSSAVASLPLKYIEAYPLPSGKWMIPQSELRACTYACEKMLLMEKKSESEVLNELKEYSFIDQRRETEEVIASIRKALKNDPHISCLKVNLNDEGIDQISQLLSKHVAKYGPSIVVFAGHDRILDDVEMCEGNHIFTVRDPFTGSQLKIKGFLNAFKFPEYIFRQAKFLNLDLISLPK